MDTNNTRIPAFSLLDEEGNIFDSAIALDRKPCVIFFYPKDDSPVCTIEACSFRDNFADFSDLGVKVIGINSGSPESHKAFKLKHRLPFTLLSDPGNTVAKSFGVKNVLFLTGRETFIVNGEGLIVHRFRSMLRGKQHVTQALKAISNL